MLWFLKAGKQAYSVILGHVCGNEQIKLYVSYGKITY